MPSKKKKIITIEQLQAASYRAAANLAAALALRAAKEAPKPAAGGAATDAMPGVLTGLHTPVQAGGAANESKLSSEKDADELEEDEADAGFEDSVGDDDTSLEVSPSLRPPDPPSCGGASAHFEDDPLPDSSPFYSKHVIPVLARLKGSAKSAVGDASIALLHLLASLYFALRLVTDRGEFLSSLATGVYLVSDPIDTGPAVSTHEHDRLSKLSAMTHVGISWTDCPSGLTSTCLTPVHVEYLASTFNKFIQSLCGAPPLFPFAQLLKFSPDQLTQASSCGYVAVFDGSGGYDPNPFAHTRYYQHRSLAIPTIHQAGPWFRVLGSYDPGHWTQIEHYHQQQLDGRAMFNAETLHRFKVFSELQRILYLFLLAFVENISTTQPHVTWAPGLLDQMKDLQRNCEERKTHDYQLLPTFAYLHMRDSQLESSLGAQAFQLFLRQFPDVLTSSNYFSISAVYAFTADPARTCQDNWGHFQTLVESAQSQCFQPLFPHEPHPSLQENCLVDVFVAAIEKMVDTIPPSDANVIAYRDFITQGRTQTTFLGLRQLFAAKAGGARAPLGALRKPSSAPKAPATTFAATTTAATAAAAVAP